MMSLEFKNVVGMGIICLTVASLCRYYETNILGNWVLAWSTDGPFWELVLPGGFGVFFLWLLGFMFLFIGAPLYYFLDNYDIVQKRDGKEE